LRRIVCTEPTCGFSQDRWTTSLKPLILVHKFSNLKSAPFTVLCWWCRRIEQWSEPPVDSAFNAKFGKRTSHWALQKTLSNFTRVGHSRLLDQVNFIFCKGISKSSHSSNAALNFPINLLLRLRLFLSLALYMRLKSPAISQRGGSCWLDHLHLSQEILLSCVICWAINGCN
jgi:hypothetical protein